MDFEWTVTKGLVIDDYDIMVEQDYPDSAVLDLLGKKVQLSLEDAQS